MNCVEQNLETERVNHVLFIDDDHKKKYGQYFTPIKISNFMASLFPKEKLNSIKLLDPGAGIGVLACSFLERIKKEQWEFESLEVDAFDIDINVTSALKKNISNVVLGVPAAIHISNQDFIEASCELPLLSEVKKYTHVIMNPPYGKISSKSKARKMLRSIGVETGNLYTGFLAAAINVTEELGHIVAIIPRSFCNGAYFKHFRDYLLQNCSIKHIHLFESRKDAFKDEAVLQENIIIHVQKNALQRSVMVSYSDNSDFDDISSQEYPFEKIIKPCDKMKVINIPIPGINIKFSNLNSSLMELGISVSTGPIVNYRMKSLLREEFIEKDTYPLLYPTHQKNLLLDWPKKGKKPNAIICDPSIKKHLFPKGNYVIIKRFTSKEERKRIVAFLVTTNSFPSASFTAENHLNIFHIDRGGMKQEVAFGLFVFLNSTYTDMQFRAFSGSTQVNATDLKHLSYPSLEVLKRMGSMAIEQGVFDQEKIDAIYEKAIKKHE